VLLYSGQATGRDFLALELYDGKVRYIYDVGAGARTLTVKLRHSVSDNRWHQVDIVRSSSTLQVRQTLHVGYGLILVAHSASTSSSVDRLKNNNRMTAIKKL